MEGQADQGLSAILRRCGALSGDQFNRALKVFVMFTIWATCD